MNAINRLMTHSKERSNDLKVLKGKGVKIVGYVPNGYMPEELVYACGAIPVGLIRGGEHEPVAASEKYLFPLLDTFCRSQIGYRVLGKELITLKNEQQKPGRYSINFNATNLPSSVYIYRLSTNSFTESKKMLLLR